MQKYKNILNTLTTCMKEKYSIENQGFAGNTCALQVVLHNKGWVEMF